MKCDRQSFDVSGEKSGGGVGRGESRPKVLG
jgi:hypothetical protein